MGWSTNAQARRYMNVTSTTIISDADVNDNLLSADREIRRKVLVHHYDEILQGNINGTNREFKVKHPPIADGDMDGDVDSSDVTAYTINNDAITGFRESTSIAVTSLVARDGIITLTTAPAADGTADNVTLDYFSISPRVIMDDVYRAASMMAAVFCLMQIGGGGSGYSYTAGRFSYDKTAGSGRNELIDKLIMQLESLLSGMTIGIRRT